jgi:SpoVK/Ycf46/Vps4 family AAA+-type ATPase
VQVGLPPRQDVAVRPAPGAIAAPAEGTALAPVLDGGRAVVAARNRLALIRQAKMKLSQEEREVLAQFREQGGNKVALTIVRRLWNLDDPDERDDVVAALDVYLTALKYW